MKAALHLLLVLLCAAALAGCATVKQNVEVPGRSLKDVRRFYVLRNLKDNHDIETRIVRALQARGFEAEGGPMTLLPASAQAVIVFEDHWAWDFSNHMVYLKLGARDPKGFNPYLTASYLKQVSLNTNPDAAVSRVVDELLATGR